MTRCMRVRRSNSDSKSIPERKEEVIPVIKKEKNGKRNGKNMTELRRFKIEDFRQRYERNPEKYGKLGSPKMMQAFLDFFNATTKDKEPLNHDHLTQWVARFPEIRRSFGTVLAPKERGLGAFASVIGGLPREPQESNMTLRRRQDKQIASEKPVKRLKVENIDEADDDAESRKVVKRNSKKSNSKKVSKMVASQPDAEEMTAPEIKGETGNNRTTSARNRHFTSKNLGTDEEVNLSLLLPIVKSSPRSSVADPLKTDEVPEVIESEETIELPEMDVVQSDTGHIQDYKSLDVTEDMVGLEDGLDKILSHKISPTISTDGLNGWRNGGRGSESESDNLKSSSSGGLEFSNEFDPITDRNFDIVTLKETPDGLVMYEKSIESDYSYGANLIVELRRLCLTNEGLNTFLPIINFTEFMYKRQSEYKNFISSKEGSL